MGVGGRLKVPEQAGSQPGQQAKAAGEPEGPGQALLEGLRLVFFPEDIVQRKEAQHRQRHLQHHQRHGHRAELVIQGQVFETEGRKGHKVAPNRHEDSQDGSRYNPPFVPAFVQEQAQHKEENGNGAHIHGPGGERLRAPVHRQALGGFLEVLLPRPFKQLDGGRFVRIHRSGR